MADAFTSVQRSAIMARVRSSNNRSTELRFVQLLRVNHVTGWRRGVKLLGRPDFVFRKERVTVFIDVCFWHGCSKHYREPTSRVNYWRHKIARNRARDKLVRTSLKRSGWKVLRIWEHDLRGAVTARVLSRLRTTLKTLKMGHERPVGSD